MPCAYDVVSCHARLQIIHACAQLGHHSREKITTASTTQTPSTATPFDFSTGQVTKRARNSHAFRQQ